MPQNIEIKARITHKEQLLARLTTLCPEPATLLAQEDTFFHSPQGRLKLRIFTTERGELIYYERPDTTGPKQSTYVRTTTEQPEALKMVLTMALGVRGMVRKQRHLYMLGQTRVHVDEVEGLGDFVELEVVLHPTQTVAEGTEIATALMQKLAIDNDALIAGAYIDLLS